jgi:ATP-binding cassette, subfamily B, bacterial
MVALVGENGSGKSTLVKLLCRLYDPTAGRITMDGIDLRDLTRAELRTQVSVMFQDYHHFMLSAAENIWFGRPESGADPERIRQAAVMAGADEVISGLPRGYDQMLGRAFEDGEELSGGQWQKIALARAFFRDAPVVILDEPSSALDVNSEHDIFKKFKTLTAGKTSVVISHRLSTVRMADRIFLLREGTIAEAGSHEELISDQGLYANLFETQAGMYR